MSKRGKSKHRHSQNQLAQVEADKNQVETQVHEYCAQEQAGRAQQRALSEQKSHPAPKSNQSNTKGTMRDPRKRFWRDWDTLERTQAVFNLLLVAFTLGLVWTSAKQWHAATGTLSELKAEQRPWVGMTRFEVKFSNDDPIQPIASVTLHYLNVGKTPAQNCKDSFKYVPTNQHSAANSFPMLNECKDDAPRLTAQTGPDLLQGIENQHTVATDEHFVQHWPDIKAGKENLFLTGCVDCDIPGGWSRTHICMRYIDHHPWLEDCIGGQQTISHINEE
jgi:hypothetical protein